MADSRNPYSLNNFLAKRSFNKFKFGVEREIARVIHNSSPLRLRPIFLSRDSFLHFPTLAAGGKKNAMPNSDLNVGTVML